MRYSFGLRPSMHYPKTRNLLASRKAAVRGVLDLFQSRSCKFNCISISERFFSCQYLPTMYKKTEVIKYV